MPGRIASRTPIAEPHRRRSTGHTLLEDYGRRSCNSYFTSTQAPPTMGTTLHRTALGQRRRFSRHLPTLSEREASA